jgi:hypothetical protein
MRIKQKERLVVDYIADDYGLYDRPQYEDVKKLFDISVARLIIKHLRKLERDNELQIISRNPMRYFTRYKSSHGLTANGILYASSAYVEVLNAFSSEISSVIDFLRSSTEDNAAWLHNVDDLGRPKKLMKCGSMAALMREHDRYFRLGDFSVRDQNDDPNVIQITAADTREYADLGIGYKLVELLTPNALRYEGAIMQHCIGRGGFDIYLDPERADVADHILLSLRPLEGNPLATIHLQRSEFGLVIKQFQAFRNSKPEPYIYDLVAPLGWLSRADYAVALDDRVMTAVENTAYKQHI